MLLLVIWIHVSLLSVYLRNQYIKMLSWFSFLTRNETSGIDDTTLREIGKVIVTNLEELATALDVHYSELERYKAINDRSGTADGTVRMLFEWRERVNSAEQRSLLREALTRAKIIRIRDEYLPWSSSPIYIFVQYKELFSHYSPIYSASQKKKGNP